MGIELKITAANATELAALIAGLAGAAPSFVVPSGSIAQDVVEESIERQRKPRKAKAEPEASAEGKVPPAEGASDVESPRSEPTASAANESTEQPETEPQVQYADVQKAVTSLAAAKGRDAVMKVYTNFGVDHATKLKEEQWVDVIAELDAAREAA